jgi:hypothetical protein
VLIYVTGLIRVKAKQTDANVSTKIEITMSRELLAQRRHIVVCCFVSVEKLKVHVHMLRGKIGGGGGGGGGGGICFSYPVQLHARICVSREDWGGDGY